MPRSKVWTDFSNGGVSYLTGMPLSPASCPCERLAAHTTGRPVAPRAGARSGLQFPVDHPVYEVGVVDHREMSAVADEDL
jgi:hypothetical protein